MRLVKLLVDHLHLIMIQILLGGRCSVLLIVLVYSDVYAPNYGWRSFVDQEPIIFRD